MHNQTGNPVCNMCKISITPLFSVHTYDRLLRLAISLCGTPKAAVAPTPSSVVTTSNVATAANLPKETPGIVSVEAAGTAAEMPKGAPLKVRSNKSIKIGFAFNS